MLQEAHESEKDACDRAREAVCSVASGRINEVEPELLKHLSVCELCRQAIYQQREAILQKIGEETSASDACSADRGSIFDFVVPWPGGSAAEVDISAFQHILTCRSCLMKAQETHRTISRLVGQCDYGVVTRFHWQSDEKQPSLAEDSSGYCGYPVRVLVAHKRARSIHLSRRRLIKTGFAAAAAIAVASGIMVLSLNTAEALSLSTVYGAINEIRNVHIVHYAVGREEPIEEKWVSRELGTLLFKIDDEFVLWDVSSGVRWTRRTPEAAVERVEIEPDMSRQVETSIRGSLGLMPFDAFSGIPQDTVWKRIETDATVPAGQDLYELSWSEAVAPTISVLYKWKLYVDVQNNVPVQIQTYRKVPRDAGFVHKSTIIAHPLTTTDMHGVLRDTDLRP